jgi:glycosyltransferase involved in cell wall biosynthesis
MNPLLSIVIPTKNRYETLFPVIQALLKYIVGTDYEIIIQDNSEENSFSKDTIEKINDTRVKYFYTSLSLSVSDNTNLAISNSNGKYITFIGDDDLVSPYILKIVSIMIDSGTDCLFYTPGHYNWEGLIFKKKYAFHSPESLTYPKNQSPAIKKMHSKQEVEKMLASGGIKSYGLLGLYHGIIKREIMNLVHDKFGSYIPSSSPDRATQVALSFVVEEYGYMNYPATITGTSIKSAGGMGLRGEHIAKLEDVSWLPKNTIEIWDKKIPKIWSAGTIYAQNIYEIFLKAGETKTINYEKLYSYMYIKEPKTKKLVRPFLVFHRKERKILFLMLLSIKSFLYMMLQYTPSFIINILVLLRGDYTQTIEIKNIKDVDICMKHLLANTKPNDTNLNHE